MRTESTYCESFCDVGIWIRRSLHAADVGQSSNVTATLGYVEVTQKSAYGTELALHCLPFAPHSQVGAAGCTFDT